MLGYLIPTTTNLTLSLIKDTAILSVITVPELTYMAQVMIGEAFAPVEGFTVIALMYWGLNSIVAAAARKWEYHSCRHLRVNADSSEKVVVAVLPETR
jgi:polar amino acid transport system permease protein